MTIDYVLLNSPVALAGWTLEPYTDSYSKISRVFLDKDPGGGLTRDRIVDNITLCWLTVTGASAPRSYWEGMPAVLAARPGSSVVSLLVGFTTLPGEIFRGPHGWAQKAYPIPLTSTRPTGVPTSPPGGPSCSRPRSGRGVQAAALTTPRRSRSQHHA